MRSAPPMGRGFMQMSDVDVARDALKTYIK